MLPAASFLQINTSKPDIFTIVAKNITFEWTIDEIPGWQNFLSKIQIDMLQNPSVTVPLHTLNGF